MSKDLKKEIAHGAEKLDGDDSCGVSHKPIFVHTHPEDIANFKAAIDVVIEHLIATMRRGGKYPSPVPDLPQTELANQRDDSGAVKVKPKGRARTKRETTPAVKKTAAAVKKPQK